MKKIKGIGVSYGIAFGKANVWESSVLKFPEYPIGTNEVEDEIRRLRDAIESTEKELIELREVLTANSGKDFADIFTFHLALLEDNRITHDAENIIRNDNVNSESALKKTMHLLRENFGKKDEDFFKDRRIDVLDIIERIVSNMRGSNVLRKAKYEDEIIVGKNLSPSQTVSLDKKHIRGFISEVGSVTSHTAIIAKAMEIPAVVSLTSATDVIKDGDTLIVDGNDGTVVINPTESVSKHYKSLRKQLFSENQKLDIIKDLDCVTKDGKKIALHANIEFSDEIEAVKKYGAQGIGLYRTEYLFLNRADIPGEEEQFHAYKNVLQKFKRKPVIIRTLDIGGDKFISALSNTKELNPFLGWRGIRFCLERQDIFISQLRAILRASAFGKLKVMFPMVSTLAEVKQAKLIVKKVESQLNKEKTKFGDVEIGIMIEIPCAALISGILAREVDFFSIGSNDLVQYTMAADRTNEKIAHLYQPCHPSVLQLIKMTIENGRNAGIWTGLCGEMASSPEMACLLVGMGIEELSMAPSAMPKVKEKIRQLEYTKLQEVAKNAICFPEHKKVYEYIIEKFK